MPPIPRRPHLRLKRRQAGTGEASLTKPTATPVTSDNAHSRRPPPCQPHGRTHHQHPLAPHTPTQQLPVRLTRDCDEAPRDSTTPSAEKDTPSSQPRPPAAKPVNQADSSRKAEGERFELSIRLTTDNGFRDRRIRPLCHPSAGGRRTAAGAALAEKEGFEPSMEPFSPITP